MCKTRPPNNTFTPLPGTITLAPGLDGAVAIGSVSKGTVSGLSIPVIRSDRVTKCTDVMENSPR